MTSNSKVVEISRRNSLLEDPFFQKHHRLDNYLIPILRDESCTSLKADLRQGFGKLIQKGRFVFVTLLIWVNVHCASNVFNGANTSRKCSIKAPAK